LWKTDARETDEEIAARGLKFMNWYVFASFDPQSNDMLA
jgi:hypothetical protein